MINLIKAIEMDFHVAQSLALSQFSAIFLKNESDETALNYRHYTFPHCPYGLMEKINYQSCTCIDISILHMPELRMKLMATIPLSINGLQLCALNYDGIRCT